MRCEAGEAAKQRIARSRETNDDGDDGSRYRYRYTDTEDGDR